MTDRKYKYNKISAYRLLPSLRTAVASKRVGGTVSRDTIHRAFNLPDEKLTGLHHLILETGFELLEAHEQGIKVAQGS